MRVLAHDLPLVMGDVRKRGKAAKRADPVWAEAEVVPGPTADQAHCIGLLPEPFIDADGRRDAALDLQCEIDRLDRHRSLDEIEVEQPVPALDRLDGLR